MPTRAAFPQFTRSLQTGICLLTLLSAAALAGGGRRLPDPVVDPHSTEICMNSRISYHSGWSAGASEQMLAEVLHAASKAPLTGAGLAIYVATPENVYLYDPAAHELILHKAGDWRSESTTAFEVGLAADAIIDAGAAMHLAQLESVTLWTGTANQLASCPKASATTYANSHWDLAEPVDIVICFGMRSVPGLSSTLVAVSSDGSLPNPVTDGAMYLDDALANLAYGPAFAAALGRLRLQQSCGVGIARGIGLLLRRRQLLPDAPHLRRGTRRGAQVSQSPATRQQSEHAGPPDRAGDPRRHAAGSARGDARIA
jgi:hypothetical protein